MGEPDKNETIYYKVPTSIYRPGDKVEHDVYFYHLRNYVIFKSKSSVWSQVDAEKLINTQVDTLFIPFKSSKEHHQFLQDKLKNILSARDVPLQRKATVLYETADPILATVFTSPQSQELLSGASAYAKSCIQYLNERGALPELIKLSSDSFSEHSHALHVSAYSVALAKRLNFQDQQTIFALGMGALLHDIGKSQIDPNILNKATELNDDEWLRIRQHPELGEKIMDSRQMVPILSRRIILEHHERVNGKGYPKGIKGVHQLSRMVAIADVFTALCADKPYAKAMTPFDALKYMITTMPHEFDRQYLQTFISMLSDS